MGNYSFPNKADDLKSRLVYTVAAEFIYRLDEYLEYKIRDSAHGALPLGTSAVVMHCCEAAIDMFSGLARSWDEDPSSPDGHPNCSTCGRSNCSTWPPANLMC